MANLGPPSHVLPDGTFARLPKLTEKDHALYFARSVANYSLISASTGDAQNNDDSNSSGAAKASSSSEVIEKKKEQEEEFIHPLAIASARLQGAGVSELSKAVNLASLVQGGEYFSLANVIDEDAATLAALSSQAAATSTAAASSDDVDAKQTAADNMQLVEEATQRLKRDRKLRASYLLQRKLLCFSSASKVLERHRRSTSASLKRQRFIDKRLLRLRKRWKLALPEHGTKVVAPASPHEIVAVDVEVYDIIAEDEQPQSMYALKGQKTLGEKKNRKGRVAKMVPRYATIELADGVVDITKAEDNGTDAIAGSIVNHKLGQRNNHQTAFAEPFALADPSLGKIDTEFDPSKVEMLTLLVSIEKATTGFSQSFIPSREKFNQGDDITILSLQHSLFCASLFDCVRHEVDSIFGSNSTSPVRTNEHATVWLSGEMEESFLPPPSIMAKNGAFSVIHSQEGEVKVRLDSEYSFTVKLIEVGAANEHCKREAESKNFSSGTSSPASLRALCRMLLLHCQFLYHDHHKIEHEDNRKTGSPNFLESCVNLGAKVLLERKVQEVFRTIPTWMKYLGRSEEILINWLPLSVFDSHAYFTLAIEDVLSIDCTITGGMLTVTSWNAGGQRTVHFSSDLELENYLKIALEKAVKSQN